MKLYNKGNCEFITKEGILKPGKTLEVSSRLGKTLVDGYRHIVEFKNIGNELEAENIESEKRKLEKEKAALEKEKKAFEKEKRKKEKTEFLEDEK